MLVDLISFMLASYGMTMIIVYGKIFDKIRPDWHIFKCTMCTGWWVGLITWFFIYPPFGLLAAPFISSGASYLLSKIVNDEGIVVKINKG